MIGLLKCDSCRKALSVAGVVGPHRVVHLCQQCLETWRHFRALIYGPERTPEDRHART